MTLIEMMIVILIVAIAATGVSYGISAMTRASLRSACMTFTAAARWAYGRSISRGTTVRLVFDMEESRNRMWFEEAHGRVTLARVDDARRAELEDDEDGTSVDPWAAAQARLDDALRPTFGASPFQQISGERFEPREIANGVTFDRLIVPHEPEPRTDGRGSIYFFPGGQTEHAILWLTDGNERVYSVELHPLTGRTRVYPYAYEPDHMLDDGRGDSRSEVND
jgi:general secretion pathway protein H